MQIVIVGHQHQFRYDPPSAGRSWAQIVGGGPECGEYKRWKKDGGFDRIVDPTKFPTVIEGKVMDGRLLVVVHDVFHKCIAGEYTFG